MKLSAILLILTLSFQSFSQDKPAIKYLPEKGKKLIMRIFVKAADKSDVVFFGELHDNPIAHWLELEMTRSLFAAKGKDLILAAEMFETDNQILIDEYFAGIIKESSFERKSVYGKTMRLIINHF